MSTAREIAEKALEAARAAQHAAEVAQLTANNVITEIRQRFDRQDTNSVEFRTSLMSEIQGQNRAFDQFKTDFEKEVQKMDRRCVGHNEALFGSQEKNIPGLVPTVECHDADINKGKWTLWLAGIIGSGLVTYVVFFYGDAMKRGIFNPTEAEWHWRVSREVKKAVKPEALKPAPPDNP